MTILRTFLATALLGLTLCVGSVYAADAPSAEAIQQTLDKLPDRKLPDADMKALQAILQQTLTYLGNKQDYEQRLVDLKRQLEDAPRQTTDNQRELVRLKATKVIPVAQRYASLPVPQLEQLLVQRTTQQGDLQKDLAEANSLTIAAQTRPERAQTEISSSQTRIQQINATLKLGNLAVRHGRCETVVIERGENSRHGIPWGKPSMLAQSGLTGWGQACG